MAQNQNNVLLPIQRGLLMNQQNITPAFTTLRELRTTFASSINIYPFTDDFTDPLIPNTTLLIIYVRLAHVGKIMNRNELIAQTCIELVSAYMNPANILSQAESRRMIVDMANELRAQIAANDAPLGLAIAAVDQAHGILIQNGGARFSAPPEGFVADAQNYHIALTDAAPIADARHAMIFFTTVASFLPTPLTHLTCIMHGFIALAKQGTTSDQYREKIVNGLLADLNLRVPIYEMVCKMIWNYERVNINPNNIEALIEHYRQSLPANAQTVRNILDQIPYTGMTSYMTILTAYEKFPMLGWNIVAGLYPDQMDAFIESIRLVGRNRYYGYVQGQNTIRSTRFKTLAWFSKEALVRLDNQRALNQYRGWSAPGNPVPLNDIIQAYMDRNNANPVAAALYEPVRDALVALNNANNANNVNNANNRQ